MAESLAEASPRHGEGPRKVFDPSTVVVVEIALGHVSDKGAF